MPRYPKTDLAMVRAVVRQCFDPAAKVYCRRVRSRRFQIYRARVELPGRPAIVADGGSRMDAVRNCLASLDNALT